VREQHNNDHSYSYSTCNGTGREAGTIVELNFITYRSLAAPLGLLLSNSSLKVKFTPVHGLVERD